MGHLWYNPLALLQSSSKGEKAMKTYSFRVFVLIGVLIILLAGSIKTEAQNGPQITQFDFDPQNGSNVGQTVTIHFAWQCSPNCGAAKVTVDCGGGDQIENTSGKFDFHWNTNGCSNGGKNVTLCTKSTPDEQWMNSNCMTKGYELTGNPPAGQPTVDFRTNKSTISPGDCAIMYWSTNGATSVIIDNNSVALSGDTQVCPTVTTKYSLRADGPGGTAYANFSIEVGNTTQQQTVNTTQSPQNNNIQPDGNQPVQPQPSNNGVAGTASEQDGIAPNGQPFNRHVPFVAGIPSLADARMPDGGINTGVYCAAMGGDSTKVTHAPDNTPNAAYSWTGCPQAPMNDFNVVCYNVWGNGYHAIMVHGTDNPGTWRCIPGDSNAGNSSGNTNTQSNTGQDTQTNQTNALGTPLQRNSDGDPVYQVAYGSNQPPADGSYVHVPLQNDGLFLRTSGDTSSHQNIIGTVHSGDYYQVIQIGNGWIQIQTSIATGWVSAKYVELTNNGQPQSVQAQPTALVAGIQVLPKGQSLTKYLKQLLAPIGKYLSSDRFDRLLTNVSHVQNFGVCLPDLIQIAQSIIAQIPSIPPGIANDCEPQGEDILGILYEAASNRQKEGGPIASKPPIASGSTVATSITWSFCIACTSQAWLSFDIPAIHYDPTSFRLTFMGNDLPIMDRSISSDGSNDKVTLHTSAAAIQQQIDAGNGDKLGDVLNWHLYYLSTK